MGDDSKDVPVGSLIAVLAEHGEDWKKIQSSSSFSTPFISNNKEESSVSTAIISDAHHPPSGRQYTYTHNLYTNHLLKKLASQ